MPKRILLADDSITIQKVVELTFSDGDYEVTAVNNGAKAVQKLGELRPDIILSDIIMPEKNGYEVCEYVKSHPEYRGIPVILLTGTFEPFDPDRAEKAGCDAVVTKPFESQSLIQKVEELIAQSQSSSSAAPEPQAQVASPWTDDAPATPPSTPFSSATQAVPALSPDTFGNSNDIFGAAPASEPSSEMPFESPAGDSPFGAPPAADDQFSGETRGFEKMSFDGLSAPADEPAATNEPAPWDEPAPDRSFADPRPSSSFESESSSSQEAPPPPAFDFSPEPPAAQNDSPFGEPPAAEEFSGETRAIPRMSFDALQAASDAASSQNPMPFDQAPASESSPWDQEAPAFGGETRAFQKMSFSDLPSAAPASGEQVADETPTAPWGEPEAPAFSTEPPAFSSEPPAFSDEPAKGFEGETRAFQKMSFDDLQRQGQEPSQHSESEPPAFGGTAQEGAQSAESDASPWSEAPEPVESLWASSGSEASPAESSPHNEPEASAPFTDETDAFAASPSPEDLPFAATTTSAPEADSEDDRSSGAAAAAEAHAESQESPTPAAAFAGDSPSLPIARGDLSEEQVDRIARRVVELMSEQVVRNIAWEVIPDVAEMLVKERIRQLESEA